MRPGEFTYYSIAKCHGQASNDNLNIIHNVGAVQRSGFAWGLLHPCGAFVIYSQLSSRTLSKPELCLDVDGKVFVPLAPTLPSFSKKVSLVWVRRIRVD